MSQLHWKIYEKAEQQHLYIVIRQFDLEAMTIEIVDIKTWMLAYTPWPLRGTGSGILASWTQHQLHGIAEPLRNTHDGGPHRFGCRCAVQVTVYIVNEKWFFIYLVEATSATFGDDWLVPLTLC